MTIRTQRWTPDTCASAADTCVFLETCDDALHPLVRTHDFQSAERLCSLHSALAASVAYKTCTTQNQRKNMTFSLAQALNSALTVDQYTFSFSSADLLTANFGNGLTASQITTLQANCDLQFGLSKVLVVVPVH